MKSSGGLPALLALLALCALMPAASRTEKVGFCPKQSTVMDCDNVIVKCETDDNCPGYEKCCEQNCKKDCMTPYRLVEEWPKVPCSHG
ncbi:omwaprin-a-like [Anolis carolinensis]|uniref:omwaprin-a-like n=1 Tax=Anolis carolinensis TaxID=28377 RepID=UPI002F2B7156